MAATFKNFVAIRKNRGGILNPAEFRSIVEMIRGILEKHDYSGFAEDYNLFLDHLADFNDPHHTTENSFYEEVIERVHAIYQKMTATPMSLEDFKADIVGSIAFLELLRRIVLNRYVYDKVKNPNGSVPAQISIALGPDWSYATSLDTPITTSFGSILADEDAFLRRGWDNPATPVPIVFNADNLILDLPESSVVFHTSSASPYFSAENNSESYPINLFGASNDFTLTIRTTTVPSAKTTVFSMMNSTSTLSIAYSPDRTVELRFGSNILIAAAPCNGGVMWFEFTRGGSVKLTTVHDGKLVEQTVSLGATPVRAFTTGMVMAPVERTTGSVFGLRELTVCKDTYRVRDSTRPMTVIEVLPPSLTVPQEGEADSTSLVTPMLTPKTGYNLYLTLLGTWAGTVSVMCSRDGGATWFPVTASGESVGVFTRNCDEAVIKVTDPRARYRLNFAITSGEVTYRLAQ